MKFRGTTAIYRLAPVKLNLSLILTLTEFTEATNELELDTSVDTSHPTDNLGEESER